MPVVAAALARAPMPAAGRAGGEATCGRLWPTPGRPLSLRAPSEARSGATSRSGCPDAQAQAHRGPTRSAAGALERPLPLRRGRLGARGRQLGCGCAQRPAPSEAGCSWVVLVHSATKRGHRSRSGVAIQSKSRWIASSACAALQLRRFTGVSMARLALIHRSYWPPRTPV